MLQGNREMPVPACKSWAFGSCTGFCRGGKNKTHQCERYVSGGAPEADCGLPRHRAPCTGREQYHVDLSPRSLGGQSGSGQQWLIQRREVSEICPIGQCILLLAACD